MGLPLVSNKIYAINLHLRSYSKNFFTNSRFLYVFISGTACLLSFISEAWLAEYPSSQYQWI